MDVNLIKSQHQQIGLLGLFKAVNGRLKMVTKMLEISQSNDIAPSKIQQLKTCHKELTYVKSRLDINNTIDQLPEFSGDVRSILNYWTPQYLKALAEYDKVPFMDNVAQNLVKSQNKARKSELIARVIQATKTAHENNQYLVFDTLTVSDENMGKFLNDPYAVRNHIRDLGRKILQSQGRKITTPTTKVVQYICVPELGSKTSRLHLHCLYFLDDLPRNTVDPNLKRKHATYREINSLKIWRYGFSTPIACRYSNDRFTREGWRWPVEKKAGEYFAYPTKPIAAVGFYMAKYVDKNQKVNSCQTNRKKHKKVSMTNNLGLLVQQMSYLPISDLHSLAQLHWTQSSKSKLINLSASKLLQQHLKNVTLKQYLQERKPQPNLLNSARSMTQPISDPNQLNTTLTRTMNLTLQDLSSVAREFVLSQEDERYSVGMSSF